MLRQPVWLFCFLICAVAFLGFCAPERSQAVGGSNEPSLIIIYTGDLQGYLEECG